VGCTVIVTLTYPDAPYAKRKIDILPAVRSEEVQLPEVADTEPPEVADTAPEVQQSRSEEVQLP